MKILYHFRTRGSGAEAVHISGIANALESLGHEVEFLNPGGVDPRRKVNPYTALKAPGFFGRVSRALPRFVFEVLEMGYNAWAWLHMRRRLDVGGHDLVYERHAFFLFASAAVARGRGVPVVLEVNELVGDARVSEQPFFSAIVRWCDRRAFERASLIVVVSPWLRRRVEALGIDPEKILVLPNAVDARDHERPVEGATVREKWNLGDAPIIGFVGWFVPWHRVELLVAAFAEIAPRHPAARLLLVAEGPLHEELARQARELGVGNRVIFAGSLPHADVPTHVAAMDVCVVPHSNEYRSPIKLFEYMAQGRAVAAPRTEPIGMVAMHGETAWLFEPGDASALAAGLDRLLSDDAARERMGAAAREAVFTRHTWRHNAQAVLRRLGQDALPS